MAKNQFNSDIELQGHKITQVRVDPMTNAARTVLAGTLGANDKGRTVYDEDDEVLYVWTGTTFIIGNLVSDWNTIINKPATFTPSIHTHLESDITDLDKYTVNEVDNLLNDKIDSTEKATPGGVASLGVDGKVPGTQLPDSVQGDMTYKGGWDANTNTPTLSSGVGENGDFYKVIATGTTLIDGINDWTVGDSLIFNDGTGVWEKFDGSGVNSVFGRQGNITSNTGDYSNAQITNVSLISGATTKEALDNISTDKADTVHTHSISEVTNLQVELDDKLNIINPAGTGIGLISTKVPGDVFQNMKAL